MNSVIEAQQTYMAFHFPLSWRRVRVIDHTLISPYGIRRNHKMNLVEDMANDLWNKAKEIHILNRFTATR